MAWIVGCDTGGTFTDMVALSDNGEFRVAKVPSTPPNFEKGVLDGLSALGVPPAEVSRIFHGTTVTTNAVITKRGAPSALITTQGFRDILEIRRANREELYDILWDPPAPLIPRRHRLEVVERVDYAGNVVTPLDEESVRRVAAKVKARNLTSVAVCLINAYMNPSHEKRIREILLEEIPDLSVSLSTDILPEPPEFERTATTVANAYCTPVLSNYMDSLSDRLSESGYGDDVALVMHNGGGTMSTDYAKGIAVKTLNSGPAAGVIAGAEIAAAAGHSNAVCLDMGGTTCEISLVTDGKPQVTTSFDLEWGMPIRFPSIDVISIGAGGGSIGWLDRAGKPRNGPQSAGASPGPACYGNGGEEATNTDAHLALRRLSNDRFLDGQMQLSVELAEEAIEKKLAEPLGLSIEEAAEGLLRIANANMVSAIRLMTVERGFDPREFTLIAFGGAGPLHAYDIAKELEMPDVIIPAHPGVTSALGLLFVDPLDDFSWSYVKQQSEIDYDELNSEYADIEGRVRDNLRRQGLSTDELVVQKSIDLRYIGQLHSITVPLESVDSAGMEKAIKVFHDEHDRQYRYSHPEEQVEISTIRVSARGNRVKPDPKKLYVQGNGNAPLSAGTRDVHFPDEGWVKTEVLNRDALAAGAVVEGPSVIEGLDTTVVVPPGVSASVRDTGDIHLSLNS